MVRVAAGCIPIQVKQDLNYILGFQRFRFIILKIEVLKKSLSKINISFYILVP